MKWIPVSYCQFCIENNATNAGKLFCFFKYESGGITGIESLKKAARYFQVSDRTIRRWLNQAHSYNWIGRNDSKLFIRGWQYLFDAHKFPVKACMEFQKKDLKSFKTFCYAAVISQMARVQATETERKSGRSDQSPAWAPLAAAALSKTLNIPEPTAKSYRGKAHKYGYIKMQQTLKPTSFNVREIQVIRKFTEKKNLIIRDEKVFEQLPNEVQPKKKIKSIRRFKTSAFCERATLSTLFVSVKVQLPTQNNMG